MLSFATLAGVVRPRLLLTSGGLETVQLREQFQRLLAAARAERPQATGPPRVCCVVTAQMAPSGGASTRSPGELRRRRWADAKKKECCSRCAPSRSLYRRQYCEENLQHLGPRHPAISDLTWYESLLVARVHPVISVVTLLSTGQL